MYIKKLKLYDIFPVGIVGARMTLLTIFCFVSFV